MGDENALVQRLLDIEEIKQLKARYFRSIDTKDWDAFAAVFAEDAVLDIPEVDIVVDGREAIVEFVSGALVGARTVHHGHMPEIELTAPDVAHGTWAMFDYVEWPEAEDGQRVGLQGYGHYIEEYVRDDGTWHISRTRLDRLRIDPLGTLPSLDSAPGSE